MDARSNIASHNVSISIDNKDIEIVLAILISREIDASMWFCRLFIQSTMTASQIYGAVSPTTHTFRCDALRSRPQVWIGVIGYDAAAIQLLILVTRHPFDWSRILLRHR